VLVSLAAWNLGNFLFFVIAGRALGPADYGLAAALLAATMVAMVPASAFQYALARGEGAADGPAAPGIGAVYRRAYRQALIVTPLAGAALAVVLLVVAGIAGAAAGPWLVTLLVVLPMVPFFLSLGQLQSEHRFRGVAVAMTVLGIPRPVFLLALWPLGIGVYAALGASALAMAAAAAVAAALTIGRLRPGPPPPAEEWRRYLRALPPLAVGLGGIALLTNLDVVVAKLSLSDHDAGQFAAVAVLAKAVILVPQAVSIVLLPRVAARTGRGRETGSLLAAAVGVTLAVGGLAALLAWPLADPIVRLTYGEEYLPAADMLAPFTAAATLLGAVIVLVNHHAGRRADAYVWGVGAVALLQPLVFLPLHGSGMQLIAADAITYSLALVLHEALHGRGPDGMLRSLVHGVRHRGAPSGG
jgi:O-antigen/teichoic acid export membrane protein